MPFLRSALPIVCLAAAAAPQDRWQLLPAAPIAPRHGATLHRVGTDLVVFGGTDVPNSHTELRRDGAVFDTQRGAWQKLPDAPLGERRGAIVVPIENGLYVASGANRWNELNSEGAALDVGKRRWRAVPKWPIAERWQPGWSADGDRVALFGGYVATTLRGNEGNEGLVTHHTCFADGVLVDTAAGTVRAIPNGPLSPRTGASVHLHGGKLLVVGGHTLSDQSIVQPLYDAAVFDLASGEWTKLEAPSLRGNSDLQFGVLGGKVFAAGRERNHGRKAIAAVFDPARGVLAPVPGTDALDFRVEATRLFAGTSRVLLWNCGMNVGDEMHQALWFAPEGWTPLALPAAVRPRQAAAFAQQRDDVVVFGGNHDIGLVLVDGPRQRDGAPPPIGCESDGLHVDLATGEVAPIPGGPLAPRGRPLAAIAGDRLYVLWGDAGHKLFADGASYRLR